MNEFINGNFIDDEEKMRDFAILSKDRFLESYSYLTEEEYDNTARLVNVNNWPVRIVANGSLEYYARLTTEQINKLLMEAEKLERNEAYDEI